MSSPPSAAAPAPWLTCGTCGDAMPPTAAKCPTCGAEVPASTRAGAPTPKLRRRFQIHSTLRATVIVVGAIALTITLALAVYQGPPPTANPLTGVWVDQVSPGNYTSINGFIDGGDYITGNYTVVTPPGALLEFVVYNSTNFDRFLRGQPAPAAQSSVNATSSLIIFSPEVTGTYFFVWVDLYSPASHISVTVYAKTTYMTDVVMD